MKIFFLLGSQSTGSKSTHASTALLPYWVLVLRVIAKCSTKLKPLQINYLIKGGSVSEQDS